MDDDPTCVAAGFIKIYSTSDKHSLYEKYGLCFFAFLRRCGGV